MSVSMTIRGADEVGKKFDNFSKNAPKAIRTELQNTASEVVQVARQNAPYLTGYLRANIDIGELTDTQVTIVSGADYSAYQRVDFMGEALRSVQGQFLKDLLTAIMKGYK